MKSLNEMTPKELRDLANQKEQESNKAFKEGYLKSDLYYLDKQFLRNVIDDSDWIIFDIKKFKEELDEGIDSALKAGAKFVCFREEDGGESWYDNYGIESMSKKWAEEHLVDIREVL